MVASFSKSTNFRIIFNSYLPPLLDLFRWISHRKQQRLILIDWRTTNNFFKKVYYKDIGYLTGRSIDWLCFSQSFSPLSTPAIECNRDWAFQILTKYSFSSLLRSWLTISFSSGQKDVSLSLLELPRKLGSLGKVENTMNTNQSPLLPVLNRDYSLRKRPRGL